MSASEKKELLFLSIQDAVSDLVFNDRIEDEELSPEDVDELIKGGHVTIDDIVDEFRKNLQNQYGGIE